MKKFLLTMAVGLLGLGAANAETVTFDFSAQNYENAQDISSVKLNDEISVTLNKGSNSNAPKYYSAGTALRLYGGNTLTITAVDGFELEKAEFTISGSNTFNSETTVSVGTFANNVWSAGEGNVASVVLTNGGTKGHARIKAISVTYAKSGAPVKKEAGLSFGETTSFTADLGSTFDAPVLINPNNLPVTYTSSNENVATVAADGKVTLVGDGETTITATSEETDKFYAGKASYTLAVAKATNNVKEFIALGDGNVGKVNFPMTVAFVNNKNIFAVDAEGDFIQVYGANSYKANDVIPAGWVGTYKYYNSNTPEIMPVGDLPASTETAVFTPKTVTAADINNSLVNNVVVLKNVEFAAATPSDQVNFEGIVDGQTLSFRNNYSIAGVEAGIYDVTIVVTIYKDAPSLYVIAYKEVAELADAPKITVDGQEFGDGNTINGEDEVTVVFPEVAEGQSIWYKTSTETETRAAEEGFSKLEGNELKLDNTIKGLSYYVGDSEGTPVTKIATVKVDIFTAVEGIEAEAGVATYYDLNGRVVKGQLEKGIYVKVVNGKASKVIVK